MRNHRFTEEVANFMLEYNHSIYINDIRELVNINQYGNDISVYLTNIIEILERNLNVINSNTSNASNLYVHKRALKTNIFRILEDQNGIRCCNKLINKETEMNNN